MSRAVRPVPARRHDPEMANYVYKGGQSLARKGKDARAPRPVAEPNPEPPRNGKP